MSFIENYRNQTTLEQRERYPNVDWQDVLFKDYTMSYNANVLRNDWIFSLTKVSSMSITNRLS